VTARKTPQTPAGAAPWPAGTAAACPPAGAVTLAGDGTPVPSPASPDSVAGALEGGAPATDKNPAAGSVKIRAGAPGTTMTEAQLDSAIRRILRDLPSVLRYHTHDSRRSPSGFPDLVCVGPRGVLYRELKTAKGQLSLAQRTWLAALSAAGADVDVWRPDALLDGTVARELAALSGLAVAT
jgi:hypothetical protein